MTNCTHAILWIRSNTPIGETLVNAARKYAATFPKTSLDIMETIGSWPSSEPELCALQDAWAASCATTLRGDNETSHYRCEG